MRIHFRSSLDHIIFLLTSHTGNSAVILHSNQQPPTICIRERTQCPGNLLAVAHLKLEIKLLMFPLLYKRFNRMFLLHFGFCFETQN